MSKNQIFLDFVWFHVYNLCDVLSAYITNIGKTKKNKEVMCHENDISAKENITIQSTWIQKKNVDQEWKKRP